MKEADTKINKIHICKVSGGGFGKIWIVDPFKVNRISTLIKLMEAKAKKCPDFVDSPELTFTISLYNNTKKLQQISIAGLFFRRDSDDDKWYWTNDLSVEVQLKECTKDILLTDCSFV